MFELFTTNKGYLHKLEGFEYVEKAKSEIIQEQKALRLVFLFQFFQEKATLKHYLRNQHRTLENL